jgi:hypothetical protein
MRLGFFQGEASEKSLSRIYPFRVKREMGSEKLKVLGFFQGEAAEKNISRID